MAITITDICNNVSPQAQTGVNYPNGAYQGEVTSNMYYCMPNYPYGYPGYVNGYPYYPTQYLTYPVYQTDPKVIELLEAIKQLLEKK